jgi:hypothetical protein
MSDGNRGTVFNQQGQTVERDQTNIGSIRGNFNVDRQVTKSDKADIGKTIATIKTEIAGLQGLPPEVRKQVNEALDSAVGISPSPSEGKVKEQLDHAGNALAGVAAQLENADDLAQKALRLAKTIFSIGKWVVSAAAL